MSVSSPRRARTSVLLAVVSTLACSGSGTTPPTDEPGSIQITFSTTALVPGRPATATAVVRDASGATVPNAPVTWSSSNTGAVMVAADGALMAVAAGNATISAMSAGATTATVALVVQEGAWLTPTGGTFGGYGGALELVMPAGAVATERATLFQRGATPLPDPTGIADAQFVIGDPTDAFAAPVTVRIRFDPAIGPYGLPRASLGVRAFQSGAWTDVAGSTLLAGMDRAEATITTGGHYGVGRRVPTAPCADAPYRALDFWLGDWDVSSGGIAAGRDVVTAEPGGCAVFEAYTNGGTQGRSISFYEPTSDAWYQTYVDNTGWRLEISGPVGAAGTLSMREAGPVVYDRWDWTLLPNGDVTQVARTTQNSGVSFGPPSWDGLYKRRP